MMILFSLIAIGVILLGVWQQSLFYIVMGAILLIAPHAGKAGGIGWSEFSPRVIGICAIIIVLAIALWNY